MSDEPETYEPETEAGPPVATLDEVTPLAVTPEILTFGMSGGFLGATINMATNPTGPNIASRTQVQLIMAPTQADLESRCISTLISEFGLTQDAALALVPAAMQPLVPAGQYLPLSGGTLVGTLGVDNTGLPQISGFSQNIILGDEQESPNASILFRGTSGTDQIIGVGRSSNTLYFYSANDMDGNGFVNLVQMSRTGMTVPAPLTASNGLKLGLNTAAGATDLSNHLMIFSSTYGINYTANQQNYIVPSSGSHKFNTGGSVRMTIATVGVTLPAVGFNFTPPVTRPVVNGAWAGNTAGKALSAALDAYGLITDGTTA
jgi:hypothetical protein